jgi:hypothetical protein
LELAKYFSIMLASMLKFFGGPIAGFVTGVNFQTTVWLSAAGMMVSVLVTTIFAKGINRYLETRPKTKKRLFTKQSRFSVKIFQKLGVFGIALLTPPLFTPIGGTLIALNFKINILKMLASMAVSAVFWGYLVSWAVFKLSFIADWVKS